MGTLSIPKRNKIQQLKEKAYALYLEGLSTREIAAVLKPKRTHVWVHYAIKSQQKLELK